MKSHQKATALTTHLKTQQWYRCPIFRCSEFVAHLLKAQATGKVINNNTETGLKQQTR